MMGRLQPRHRESDGAFSLVVRCHWPPAATGVVFAAQPPERLHFGPYNFSPAARSVTGLFHYVSHRCLAPARRRSGLCDSLAGFLRAGDSGQFTPAR